MNGVDFPGSNFELVKPEDMTDEQCNSLPAYRGTDEQGFNFIMVAFKPSEKELEALNNGQLVYLKVIGTLFPPVAIFTVDENNNYIPD